MKIIEECSGRGNKIQGCGAKLIVELEDLSTTSARDSQGDWVYTATFSCPLCGTPTDLNMSSEIASKLPLMYEF